MTEEAQNKDEELMQVAVEMSVDEVELLMTYLRAYHWLTTYNQNRSLMRSPSSGIQLPDKFLRQVCVGFNEAKQVFFLQLQPQEYEIFSKLPLQGCWLEHGGFCVYFQPFKYGNYKMPALKLSFRVYSEKLLKKMKMCSDFTLAKIETSPSNESKKVITQVKNPTVDFLHSPPSGRSVAVKNFSRAFGG